MKLEKSYYNMSMKIELVQKLWTAQILIDVSKTADDEEREGHLRVASHLINEVLAAV